jgi:hypothetical protein
VSSNSEVANSDMNGSTDLTGWLQLAQAGSADASAAVSTSKLSSLTSTTLELLLQAVLGSDGLLAFVLHFLQGKYLPAASSTTTTTPAATSAVPLASRKQTKQPASASSSLSTSSPLVDLLTELEGRLSRDDGLS